MNIIPALYRVQLVREKKMSYAEHGITLDKPDLVADMFHKLFKNPDREYFVCFVMDGRSKMLAVNTVSIGTLSASLVHPREVFKPAILASAAAIIVAHNHPSGEVDPSAEDKDATRRLVRAGRILGIPVLDHIVIGEKKFFSFRHEGLIA